MRKEKFFYNKHTLQYEKVVASWKTRFLQIFGFLSGSSVFAFLMLIIFYSYFPSPREKTLLKEIEQLKTVNQSINKQMGVMAGALDNMQDRDAGIYRAMFGMNPIDAGVWDGGIGGHEKYADLQQFRNSYEALTSSLTNAEKLTRQLAIQSKSLDTIQRMVNDKEKMLASMPTIKPVREDKLNRSITLLSGFGWRLHPIYKVNKFHKGLDFAAKQGTPIQSTGDGVIVKVEHNHAGYGNSVVISHGYGYETLYGHMYRIDVKEGEHVKRGQQIGLVGDTGSSTAPHCHYEVHYHGKEVNPINYCMDGLTPAEYASLVKIANTEGQSFD